MIRPGYRIAPQISWTSNVQTHCLNPIKGKVEHEYLCRLLLFLQPSKDTEDQIVQMAASGNLLPQVPSLDWDCDVRSKKGSIICPTPFPQAKRTPSKSFCTLLQGCTWSNISCYLFRRVRQGSKAGTTGLVNGDDGKYCQLADDLW